jgi:hypothetical protein
MTPDTAGAWLWDVTHDLIWATGAYTLIMVAIIQALRLRQRWRGK